MKNHTKGTWAIWGVPFHGETTICSGETRIAEVKHWQHIKGDPPLEEGLANARLILKAPEMLSLLEEALGFEEVPRELKLKIVKLIVDLT